MKTDLKVKQEALIYTKESVARVLGVTVKAIGRTMVWAIGFWIWIKGRRPRLYKKSLFEAEFANFRRNSSKHYTVVQIGPYKGTPDAYRVTAQNDRNHSYQVTDTVTENGKSRLMKCGCEDYVKMSQAFKAPVCKHGYAVLSYLGYTSLKEANKAHANHYGYTAQELDARAALGI